jgi:hypothetical protein
MSNETWLDMNDPAVIERIRQEAEQGPIVVEYYHPHSGGGPSLEAFLTVQDFLDFDKRRVERFGGKRNRGEYVFWSVADLYKQRQVLFHAAYDVEKKRLFSEEELKQLEEYLKNNSEGVDLLRIWERGKAPENDSVSMSYSKSMEEFLTHELPDFTNPDSELYIFPSIFRDYKYVLLRAKRSPI